MVITQNMNLSKEEYYQTLAGSVAIFSCALHENLGISVMEAVLTGAIPIVPDRASYKEMYLPEFKYPSEWTESYEDYLKHKTEIIAFIADRINNYDKYQTALQKQKEILQQEYLNCNVMTDHILNLKK
jgi:hypothetical protein